MKKPILNKGLNLVEPCVIVREKREEIGWTIEQASHKTGIPIRYIEDIENNTFRSFEGKVAVLESHIRVYVSRLGISQDMKTELLDSAKNKLAHKKFNFLDNVAADREID